MCVCVSVLYLVCLRNGLISDWFSLSNAIKCVLMFMLNLAKSLKLVVIMCSLPSAYDRNMMPYKTQRKDIFLHFRLR